MRRPEVILWTAAVALAGTTLGGLGRTVSAAHRTARLNVNSFRTLADQIREYRHLEAQTATLDIHQPSTSLAEEIGEVLAAAGLPPTTLASLSPDSVQGSASGPLIRLRAGMTLTKVTLPQLGRFLLEWRQRQGSWVGWTVTAIDLSPDTGTGEATAAGTGRDLPLRAVMTLESIATQGADQ